MVVSDDFRRGGQVVKGRDQDVPSRSDRNAVTVRQRLRVGVNLGRCRGKLAEVVAAVPTALELEYLVSAGGCPCQSQRGKGCFAARGLKAHGLTAGHRLDELLC